MDLKQIAQELVDGCRAGNAQVRANVEKLYAENAVSVEAADMSGKGRQTEGRAGIMGKHDWWEGAMEEHSVTITGPFWHGDDQFSAIFEMDVTEKESGNRMQMQEIAVYHVADGKIVREEFHYPVE